MEKVNNSVQRLNLTSNSYQYRYIFGMLHECISRFMARQGLLRRLPATESVMVEMLGLRDGEMLYSILITKTHFKYFQILTTMDTLYFQIILIITLIVSGLLLIHLTSLNNFYETFKILSLYYRQGCHTKALGDGHIQQRIHWVHRQILWQHSIGEEKNKGNGEFF